MCDVLEPYESYAVCELIRHLGALYDKERKQGTDNGEIKRERQHVSARLISLAAQYESNVFRACAPKHFSCIRES